MACGSATGGASPGIHQPGGTTGNGLGAAVVGSGRSVVRVVIGPQRQGRLLPTARRGGMNPVWRQINLWQEYADVQGARLDATTALRPMQDLNLRLHTPNGG